MKQTGFIRGDTDEAKFASIERALQRLSRRSHKQVGVKVPPIPVSGFVEAPLENGVIARYMFPSVGKVRSGVIVVEEFPEDIKRVPLTVDIKAPEESSSKQLEITPKVNVLDIGLEVSIGSRFELRLSDPNVEIRRIWWGLTYQIEIKQAELVKILHNELEQNERI